MLESHHKALNLRTAALVAASCLLALAFRLPGLGSGSLVAVEQTAFVESQGLDPWAEIAEGEPVTSEGLRRRVGAWAVARGSRFFPLHSGTLAWWSGRAGTSEAALRLPSAMAGGLTVALVAWIALQLAGPHAAVAAGLLVALSPIHTLASREAAPGPLLLMVLVLTLGLALRLDRDGSSRVVAAAHGLALGLVAIGPAAFAVVGVLQIAWLVARAERRSAAVVSALVALAVFAAARWGGLLRSPLVEGADLDWVPTTTISGLVRCAGASFTRVAGFEHHLVAPHARHLAPLTLLVLTLVALGARGLTPRRRWLLLGGLVAPFAVGSFLSVVTGQVAPLQAWRVMPALPFVAILAGAGVASLGGWTSRAAAAVVLLSTGAFLALALSAPRETSPTRALAREIARCRPPGAVTSVQRRLDLLALAAWQVPGPLLLQALPAPTAGQRTIRVDPLSACAKGFVSRCRSLPGCPPE